MRGRWTFTPRVTRATREPPLDDPLQLVALQEMLDEIAASADSIDRFLNCWWPDMLARANDPDAEYCGNGIAFRVSAGEVILTPLYDQWGEDVTFVYVPLADVQDMLDQLAAYERAREHPA